MKHWQNEFPQAQELLYLNHAAVAPWPQRTHDAVCRFAAENLQHGARHYPRWMQQESQLREQLRRLIGAPSSDDIALLKNTSEGLSVIAAGLDWQPGDQVVISNQEFPSNRIPWLALADQGVSVVEVDISGTDPEQALINAIGPRTRLLAISSVQYGSGLCMDLERLGDTCQQHQVLFCVDAIQSLGVLPMDVGKIHADFVVADGHKWMLGPEGLALFYCRAALREQLRLHQFGWHMIEHAGDYSRSDWQPAADARRFECGSPNMLCIHALSASLSLLEDVGIEAIQQLVASRTALLADGLTAQGLTLLSHPDPARRAGIVTFAPHGDSTEAYRKLMVQGLICAPRGGGVRLSPHFYTPDTVLERALELIANLD